MIAEDASLAIRITRSVVPNLFTLANLFCGFSAIVLFSRNDFGNGALLILFSAIFDMLDGVMARLTHSASELGVELDSLCDAVSFGVAPSFMLYMVHYHNLEHIGILMASLPAMAGVFRLARFNAQLTSLEDKQYFRGMPIPAGALTVVSFVIFLLNDNKIHEQYRSLSTNFVTIATALAMVSTIRYDNLPRPSLRSLRERPFIFIAVLLSLILCIVTRGEATFYCMLAYMLFGAFRHALDWWKNMREIDDEMDDDEEDDDDDN